ncbi:hypothetical protein [Almyronema epifaneia]|uniref:Roadblock/LC7 domain-containing protein n=1 Tax=Almyronema epifaneia S1 TaxID=2991925 RepID=A0ABW6IL19_9CYAN
MSPPPPPATSGLPAVPDDATIQDILGVAIFDMNGLPREYYVTPSNTETSWVQTVFQALGLKSLLTASLRLEGFQHIVIHTAEHAAVVIRQKNCYTALLMRGLASEAITETFVDWVRQFEAETLRNSPYFRAA